MALNLIKIVNNLMFILKCQMNMVILREEKIKMILEKRESLEDIKKAGKIE